METCHICGRDTEHDPGTGYDPICECAAELITLRARVAKLEAAIRKLDATDTAYRHSGLGDPAQAYADLISLVQ